MTGQERLAQKNAVRLDKEMEPKPEPQTGRYGGLYDPKAPYGQRYSVWLGTESLIDGEFITPNAIEGEVAVFKGDDGRYLFDAL